ncbi:MAG: NAD(P)-dependent oxidoreductase [Anaerolineae bacterium]|nr:NAD(P)-dependent oxidoreductase [Anaerolineae bacterium]
MKIMVTGSRGWAGVGIVPNLLDNEHEVVGFDLSPVPEDGARRENLREVQGNITDPLSILSAMEGIDAIVHSVAGRDHDNAAMHRVYVSGTQYLLDVARQCGVRQVVIMGSSAVILDYIADWSQPMIAHEYKVDAKTPPKYHGFYGLVKHLQEELGEFYARQHKMSVTVFRPWWIVDGARFCTRFGTPLTEDTHPLTPTGLVDRYDLGEACHLALQRPGITYDVFYPVAGPEAERFFDVAHIRRELGWQPRYTFQELPIRYQRIKP